MKRSILTLTAILSIFSNDAFSQTKKELKEQIIVLESKHKIELDDARKNAEVSDQIDKDSMALESIMSLYKNSIKDRSTVSELSDEEINSILLFERGILAGVGNGCSETKELTIENIGPRFERRIAEDKLFQVASVIASHRYNDFVKNLGTIGGERYSSAPSTLVNLKNILCNR